jgi:hypothetical protein
MKAILLGTRPLDFTTNDGSLIKGTQLFIAFDEDDVVGKATDKLFVKDGIDIPKLEINKPFNVYFNRKGKVEAITN